VYITSLGQHLMMVCNAYTHARPTHLVVQDSIFSWTYSIHNVGFSLC